MVVAASTDIGASSPAAIIAASVNASILFINFILSFPPQFCMN
jgi:hypothetical protein